MRTEMQERIVSALGELYQEVTGAGLAEKDQTVSPRCIMFHSADNQVHLSVGAEEHFTASTRHGSYKWEARLWFSRSEEFKQRRYPVKATTRLGKSVSAHPKEVTGTVAKLKFNVSKALGVVKEYYEYQAARASRVAEDRQEQDTVIAAVNVALAEANIGTKAEHAGMPRCAETRPTILRGSTAFELCNFRLRDGVVFGTVNLTGVPLSKLAAILEAAR